MQHELQQHVKFLQRTRTSVQAFAAGIVVFGATPFLLQAQVATGGIRRAQAMPSTNICAQLSDVPSRLVETPEGLAILKMKSEVAAAMAATAARRDEEKTLVEARRLTEFRNALDSLGRVVITQSEGSRSGQVRIFFDSNPAARRDVEATIRKISPQVAQFTDRAMLPGTAARSLTPSGWIGISSSGYYVRRAGENGTLVTRYCEYPVVETVEVESPAEKAGVLSGDTIIAYNGKDLLENDLDNVQVFVEGKLVRVKVHRAGKVREMAITAAKRPPNMATVIIRGMSCSGVNCTMQGGGVPFDSGAFTFKMHVDTVRAAGGATSIPPRVNVVYGAARGGSGGAGGVTAAPLTNMPGMPPSGGFMFAMGNSLRGASLLEVDSDMAAMLGVDSVGVVIIRVMPNSPAALAGLKPGEAIREVNGTPVRDVPSLQRIMAASDKVRLVVTSKAAPSRIVVLR